MSDSKNKLRVIYIISSSPRFAYNPGNDALSRAAKIWTNDSGEMLGVWREDWGNQIGTKILESSQEIEYEVWRPDIRADRVYSHTFENGLVNRSFPVQKGFFFDGLVPRSDIYSGEMEYLLDSYLSEKRKLLLIFPVVRKLITLRLVNKYSEKIPILTTHFTNTEVLVKKMKCTLNLIKMPNTLVKGYQQFTHTVKTKNIAVAHHLHIGELKRFLKNVYFITVGVDQGFWYPNISQENARSELNIPLDTKVFLISCRLVKEYQIHKVLKMISKLEKDNFLFIFTSQGDQKYVKYLMKLKEKYNLDHFVKFAGYVPEDTLKLYYIACDFFMMTSVKNAGPLSSILALIMGKPLITTDSGLAAEIIYKHKSGLLLDRLNYKDWVQKLGLVLSGSKVKILDQNIVRKIFDWDLITKEWIRIIEDVRNNFESDGTKGNDINQS